jgi:hypothetical protein
LLEQLNIPVVGYSLPAGKDSLYDRAERTGAIPEAFADIRNYHALEQFIDLHKPSIIIHMASKHINYFNYSTIQTLIGKFGFIQISKIENSKSSQGKLRFGKVQLLGEFRNRPL